MRYRLTSRITFRKRVPAMEAVREFESPEARERYRARMDAYVAKNLGATVEYTDEDLGMADGD